MSVRTISVIETKLQTYGNGVNNDSPVRIITQYWTTAGEFIVEIDPTAFHVSPEKLASVRGYIERTLSNSEAAKDIVDEITKRLK